MHRTAVIMAAVAALIGSGCDRAAAPEQPQGGETSAAAPEAEPGSGASLDQRLAFEAKKYAPGFVASGPVIHGQLSEGARSDHLLVLRAGHCYRVVAAGGEGVEDLDLVLFDPNDVQTQQDPAEDRFPVLGLQTEICPSANGAYRLQAVMYKGAGAFVARLYQTQ